MNNKVTRIRNLILDAKQHDGISAQRSGLLSERVNQLHEAIKLPPQEAANLLATFVVRYITQVPEFIDAITEMSKEAGIYSFNDY